MKQTISSEDLRLLNKGLATTGIRLALAPDPGYSRAVPCAFIDNPDGTLRWLWPQQGRRASFLKFYHTGSARSKMIAFIIRLALLLGLGRLVISGTVVLYLDEKGSDMLQELNDWALFSGTAGIARKLIGWFHNESGAYFIKMPLTDLAADNIHNELMALREPDVKGMVRPGYCRIRGAVMIQSDLYADKKWKAPAKIEDLPAAALQHWLKHDMEFNLLQTTNWWKSAQTKLAYLNRRENGRFSNLLLERLDKLMASFRPDMLIPVAPAHGDFTPWNIRCSQSDIAAIDWELFDGNRPALYDLFHFIYQENILIHHAGYTAIRQQLDALFIMPEWQHFLQEQHIDVAVAEQLYLIHTITYYLDLYIRQEKWHIQIDWLLQVWCEALGSCLQKKLQLSSRGIILEDLVHYLRNTPYASLKLQVDEISDLPLTADLDLCLNRKDAPDLIRWMATHEQVASFSEKHFSFMRRLTLILHDDSFLHIDCIWAVRRKNIIFMDAGEIIAHACTLSSGVKVACVSHEVEYTWLFHLLNRSAVPDRHCQRFLDNPACHIAADLLVRRYALDIPTGMLFSYDPAVRKKMRIQLLKYKANRGIGRWKSTLAYLWDCCRQLWPEKGYLITFSGVDGAGKSTVIASIAHSIDKELRMPVVVLRHRPSLLPILSAWKYGKAAAEERSVQSLPHCGKEQQGIRSLLRFAYYYTDYLLGQFYIQLRYVYRGYVVLYDRYYFDFISDSKRSNLVVPAWLSYGLYRFLVKPDFNYFLFAPTELILKRKQELEEHTINMLTRKYLLLFTRLRAKDHKHTYDAVCNIDLDTTLHTIFNNLKNQKLCAVS